jgi:hypothetical protein
MSWAVIKVKIESRKEGKEETPSAYRPLFSDLVIKRLMDPLQFALPLLHQAIGPEVGGMR